MTGSITLLLGLLLTAGPAESTPPVDVVLVQGAAGSEEYADLFQRWTDEWKAAAETAGARYTLIGRDELEETTDRERFQRALERDATSDSELWLVFIGHGTFDRRDARFNLRGPDVSAAELKQWLSKVQRPVAVIDTSSASAPFLVTLTGPDRVIITATKSGGEQNFARFGEYLAAAITDPAADLDKDEQISLWEAYLFASRRTDEFYKTNGRLQTEHALLDDNGDGQGTRADAFDGLEPRQVAASASQSLDGERAHQWHLIRSPVEAALPPAVRRQRDQLERDILALKRRKSELPEADYYQQLDELLLRLARLDPSTQSGL